MRASGNSKRSTNFILLIGDLKTRLLSKLFDFNRVILGARVE